MTQTLTAGNNGLYQAHTGWNPVAGLGSVNIDALASDFSTASLAAAQDTVTSSSASAIAAGETVTLYGTGFGAAQGNGYIAFHDNSVNWGAPGNAAAFQIDSWSNTAITFTVPTPSGSNGQSAVTPGTMATMTVTNSAGETSSAANLAISSS